MRCRDRLLVIALALLAPAAAYAQGMGLGAGTPDAAMVYPRGGATSPGLDFIFSSGPTALWYEKGVSACSSAATCLTVARTTTNGSATDLLPISASGQTITTFANNTARVSSAAGGLIIETATVNQLLNATAPVTQTTASVDCSASCTLWVNGAGTATPSAGTATGCSGFAAASQGTPDTFICVAGTIVVTVAGLLNAFQLETGTFGTSLCTSGASACSRGTDAVTVTSVPAIGASYTLFASGTPLSPTANAANQNFFVASDGTTTNRGSLQRTATTGLGTVTTVGTAGTLANFVYNGGTLNASPAAPQNVLAKGAATFTSASGMTALNIGSRPDGTVNWNGTVARVSLWPTVALTGAQLQAITK